MANRFPDTRALRPEELDPTQRQAIEALVELVQEVSEDRSSAPPQDSWPPHLEHDRKSRVFMLSGIRGTGKSSTLLTLLHLWQDDSRRLGWTEGERARVGLSDAIGPLVTKPLDLDLLPSDVHPFAGVVLALHPLTRHVSSALQTESPDGFTLIEQWESLFRAALVGWSGSVAARDPAEYVVDQVERQTDWLQLTNTFHRFVDTLLKLAAQLGMGTPGAPLVIPIDDADLFPSSTTNLLLATRTCTHPRVVFLLCGDRNHMRDLLRLEWQAREPKPPTDEPLRSQTLQRRKQLADAALDKHVPPVDTIVLRSVPISKALGAISEGIGGVEELLLRPRPWGATIPVNVVQLAWRAMCSSVAHLPLRDHLLASELGIRGRTDEALRHIVASARTIDGIRISYDEPLVFEWNDTTGGPFVASDGTKVYRRRRYINLESPSGDSELPDDQFYAIRLPTKGDADVGLALVRLLSEGPSVPEVRHEAAPWLQSELESPFGPIILEWGSCRDQLSLGGALHQIELWSHMTGPRSPAMRAWMIFNGMSNPADPSFAGVDALLEMSPELLVETLNKNIQRPGEWPAWFRRHALPLINEEYGLSPLEHRELLELATLVCKPEEIAAARAVDRRVERIVEAGSAQRGSTGQVLSDTEEGQLARWAKGLVQSGRATKPAFGRNWLTARLGESGLTVGHVFSGIRVTTAGNQRESLFHFLYRNFPGGAAPSWLGAQIQKSVLLRGDLDPRAIEWLQTLQRAKPEGPATLRSLWHLILDLTTSSGGARSWVQPSTGNTLGYRGPRFLLVPNIAELYEGLGPRSDGRSIEPSWNTERPLNAELVAMLCIVQSITGEETAQSTDSPDRLRVSDVPLMSLDGAVTGGPKLPGRGLGWDKVNAFYRRWIQQVARARALYEITHRSGENEAELWLEMAWVREVTSMLRHNSAPNPSNLPAAMTAKYVSRNWKSFLDELEDWQIDPSPFKGLRVAEELGRPSETK